jgi:hypothetical protein
MGIGSHSPGATTALARLRVRGVGGRKGCVVGQGGPRLGAYKVDDGGVARRGAATTRRGGEHVWVWVRIRGRDVETGMKQQFAKAGSGGGFDWSLSLPLVRLRGFVCYSRLASCTGSTGLFWESQSRAGARLARLSGLALERLEYAMVRVKRSVYGQKSPAPSTPAIAASSIRQSAAVRH